MEDSNREGNPYDAQSYAKQASCHGKCHDVGMYFDILCGFSIDCGQDQCDCTGNEFLP